MALTPTLTDQQIRENLNALQKAGKSIEERQAYVNNYQKGADGNYILKTSQPVKTIQPEKQPKEFGATLIGGKAMTGQEFVSQPKIKQYAQAFVQTLPKDVYDFAIKTPLEFLKSVGETIGYAASGGKEVPDLGGYVSEAKKALDEGAKPFGLEAMVIPAVKTIAGGSEVYGGVKAAENIASKIAEISTTKKALEQTMPVLNKMEKETVEKTGSKLTGVKPVPTAYEKEIAETAKPFISNNIVKTEKNIKQAIKDISIKEILPGLETSSTNISKGVRTGLLEQLKNIEPLDITKADPIKSNAFNLFKERVINAVGNAENDKELFKIRQVLNDAADIQSGGKMWDETGKLNPIQEFWKGAYRTIGELLKERNPELGDQLSKQTKLFDALGGVTEKTGKLVGKTGTIPGVIKKIGKAAAYTGAGVGIGAGISKISGR